jgi:hypothetical protein
VALYETPDKPANALNFLKASVVGLNVDELQVCARV